LTLRGDVVGFAGTEFALSNRMLIVYWHGSPPAVIKSVLSKMPQGYKFVVRHADYSLDQLEVEMIRLLQANSKDPNSRVVRIGPRNDYSGLVIGFDVPTSYPLPAFSSTVPVTVIRQLSGVPLSRQTDSPPFWGGARLNLAGAGKCTSGFTLVRWADGVRGLTTADHCGENSTFTTGNNQYTVGTSGSCCYTIDTVLLTGKTYGASIYTGAWNSGTAANVAGSAYPSVNQYVCAGGSYSGEQCSAQVTATNQYYMGHGLGYFAQHNDGSPLAGHGDSGGPSYSYASGSSVTAYGFVDQGEFQSSSCAGVTSPPCYYAVFFTNERDAESALNASIATS
jgi:hypothetical protein